MCPVVFVLWDFSVNWSINGNFPTTCRAPFDDVTSISLEYKVTMTTSIPPTRYTPRLDHPSFVMATSKGSSPLNLDLYINVPSLGENYALAANQWEVCRATILFTISLNSAKVWNRGFNWPVFGVVMPKKSPNVTLTWVFFLFWFWN